MGRRGTKHGENNPFFWRKKKKWAYKCVIVGPDGKPKKCPRLFDTEQEAWDFKKKFESNPRGSMLEHSYTPTQIREIHAAFEKLLPYRNASLDKCISFWVSQHPLDNSVTIKDAVDDYLLYRKPMVLEDSDGSSTKQIRAFRRFGIKTYKNRVLPTLNQLRSAFGEKAVAAITATDIKAFLDKQRIAEETFNNKLSDIKVYFEWCIEVKKCLEKNPASKIHALATEFAMPEIYTVDEIDRIFKAATSTDPELLPFLILATFAGVRTCEIERMNATDIDFDIRKINIRALVGKRKKNGGVMPREIEGLPKTGWDWLTYAGGKSITINTTNLQKRRESVFRKAKVPFRPNALRHSYATYAYAHFQNDAIVRKQVGHRIEDTFFTHYAAIVSKSDGDAYFRILPPKKSSPPKGTYKPHGTTKITWPSDEDLMRMIKSSSNNKVAKKLGVSEAAVRKRLKRFESKNSPC